MVSWVLWIGALNELYPMHYLFIYLFILVALGGSTSKYIVWVFMFCMFGEQKKFNFFCMFCCSTTISNPTPLSWKINKNTNHKHRLQYWKVAFFLLCNKCVGSKQSNPPAKKQNYSWALVFFFTKFCQISTWNIWFHPMQRIFHGNWSKFIRFWKKNLNCYFFMITFGW